MSAGAGGTIELAPLTLEQIRAELVRMQRPLQNARSLGPVMAGAVLARIAELVDELARHVEEIEHRIPVPYRLALTDELDRHAEALEAMRALPSTPIGEVAP